MVKLEGDFKLKDVSLVTVPESGSTASEESRHAAATMKTVDDKDL